MEVVTKPLGPHQRAIVFAVWMAALSYSLPAAAQSMAPAGACAVGQIGDCLVAFEWKNLLWAVLVAVVGGISRTVLTLLSPAEVVYSVFREGWKDVMISSILGSAAYAAILAYNVVEGWPNVPTWTTVFILAAVGWSRTAALAWAERAGGRLADGSIDALIRRIGGQRGYGYGAAPGGAMQPPRPPLTNPDDMEP